MKQKIIFWRTFFLLKSCHNQLYRAARKHLPNGWFISFNFAANVIFQFNKLVCYTAENWSFFCIHYYNIKPVNFNTKNDQTTLSRSGQLFNVVTRSYRAPRIEFLNTFIFYDFNNLIFSLLQVRSTSHITHLYRIWPNGKVNYPRNYAAIVKVPRYCITSIKSCDIVLRISCSAFDLIPLPDLQLVLHLWIPLGFNRKR